jgi:MarR family 2-MHQ and catechol resistance regulon transcriptional repressor
MSRDQQTTGIHLWLVLWKTYTAVREYAVADIERSCLSLTDFAILEALLHKGPLPVNEIGRKVDLTSGSMTTAIDRLHDRKLVERREAEADRRARVVHLTPAGRKLITAAFDAHSRTMDALGEALSESERGEAIRLLKKLGMSARKAAE